MDALKALDKERKTRMKQYPEPRRLRGASSRSSSFYDAAADARRTARRSTTSTSSGRCSAAVRHKPVARPFQRSSAESWREAPATIRIGIPRVLNLYSTAPFWRTYFEALGVDARNVVFSDETVGGDVGGGRQVRLDRSVLPVARSCQAHIHNLLFKHHEKKPLNYIFFPCITHIPTFVVNQMDTTSCPIVAGTPKVIRAAFTKEIDFFAERGIEYLDTAVTLNEPN